MAERPDDARLVAEERAAFAALLRTLDENQWQTPSLCEGWSVEQVAAHVAGTNRSSVLGTLGNLIAAGLSPDRFNRRQVRQWSRRGRGEIADAVGEPELVALLKLSPAGALAEAVIHQQDVRRPLGIPREYPRDCLVAVLEATCRKTLGTGSKRRVRGLRLVAADAEWTSGEGPEVSGPAEALIMAANGRRAALPELSGAGVGELSERM